MQFKRNLILFFYATALILNGCASVPPASNPPPAAQTNTQNAHEAHLAKLAQISNFALKGRIGVVTQKQGFSGGINWQHAPATDNIDVFSPLGGQLANISKTSTEVTLTTQDGHSIKANDAETLTDMTLGFRLPLSGLSDWALGRPTKNKIDAQTWDDQGRLTTLKQDGWDMAFESYAENNGVDIPNKIVLKSEKVNLKLLVEKWSGF